MRLLFVTLLIVFCFIDGGVLMASPIAKTWVYATVLIENEWGSKGTGFLVKRITEGTKGKIFLCTNKHVLHSEESMRDKATMIRCHVNTVEQDGSIKGKYYDIPLVYDNGRKSWREHPDSDVDVLVIDVTILMAGVPEIIKAFADYSLFATKDTLVKEDITIGDEVTVVGYPLGFKQGENNFPIVRQGIIASMIGTAYQEVNCDAGGIETTRTVRGFLIDRSCPWFERKPSNFKACHGTFSWK